MKRFIRFCVLAALSAALALFAGCSASSQTAAPVPEDGAHLTIASLKGPTSIGLAKIMQDDSELYTFDIEGSADAIVPQIVQGTVDIALVPANLAATLYQKTEGGIQVIGINTLGVLYGVSQNAALTDVASLKGATVYMTGKGTVPQYTFEALLSAAGLSVEDLTIEFKSEPAEVVAAISADDQALGILPQPYVTAATTKNEALSVCFDLTEQWETLMGADAGQLLTGVTIVRNEVLEQYPQAVAKFLADHAESVEAVNAAPADYAQAVVDAGIVDNVVIAEKAIPACNVVSIAGVDMKTALSGYLSVLYAQEPSAVGGQLPDDAFYYVG